MYYISDVRHLDVIDLEQFEFEVTYLPRPIREQLRYPHVRMDDKPVVSLISINAIYSLPYPDPEMLLEATEYTSITSVYSYAVDDAGVLSFVEDGEVQSLAYSRTIDILMGEDV